MNDAQRHDRPSRRSFSHDKGVVLLLLKHLSSSLLSPVEAITNNESSLEEHMCYWKRMNGRHANVISAEDCKKLM